jgi:hypothetical protein
MSGGVTDGADLSEPRNRLSALLASHTLNGVDFVALVPGQPNQLRVYVLNTVPLQNLAASITGGSVIPMVSVGAVSWITGQGAPFLLLDLPSGPGDASVYTLTLRPATGFTAADTGLDPFTNNARFSFNAQSATGLDCATPPVTCPPDDTPLPVIDYTAKDFSSFLQALSAFSTQNYPNWQERSEADAAVVVMEALAALADELSYYQDRVAAEATMSTATQRRSLVSQARLVDYEPTPVRSATTLLTCTVADGVTAIAAGTPVSAAGADGTPISFEIGTGLADTTEYPVSEAWNGPIWAYWPDDDVSCLPAGATTMWLQGALVALPVGSQVLIQTDLPGRSLRQIVTLASVDPPMFDEIFTASGTAQPVTGIAWNAADALTDARDLSVTFIAGNVLPATQGTRFTESFAIPAYAGTDLPPAGTPIAIARRGSNGSDASPNLIFRWPLAQSPVAWLAPPANAPTTPLVAANALQPELRLTQTAPETESWAFLPNLLGAGAQDRSVTVDPVAWRAVATNPDGSVANWEMDGDNGECLRFGDDVFGQRPVPASMFTVTYRVSRGSAGNVAADTVRAIDPTARAALLAVSNPLPASGGADAETADHIRRMAPFQFQATQYRAVQPADYAAAAETLPFVSRADCTFRWTGSWLSAFTVIDPVGTDLLDAADQATATALLNRRRLAGYESFVLTPAYVSIDLVITVVAAASALCSEVEAAVLAALGLGNTTGFFSDGRFSAGAPLYSSALAAAVQGAAGVLGVLSITYTPAGVSTLAPPVPPQPLPAIFTLSPNHILRVLNDPNHPDLGTVVVLVESDQ